MLHGSGSENSQDGNAQPDALLLRLPHELLARIIWFAQDLRTWRHCGHWDWACIMCASRRLCDVARSSPALWAAVSTRGPRARIDAHLTRAGDCPLHVVADVDSAACAQTTTALLARTCTADVRIVVPRCVPLGDADWSPACQKLCQAAAALCEQSGTGGLSVRAPLRDGTSASALVHLEPSYIPLRAPVPALRHLGLVSVKAPAEDGWIDQWLATMPRLAQLRLKDVTVGADVPPFREREHVTLRQFHIHNSADGRWLQRWLAAAPSSGRSTWM